MDSMKVVTTELEKVIVNALLMVLQIKKEGLMVPMKVLKKEGLMDLMKEGLMVPKKVPMKEWLMDPMKAWQKVPMKVPMKE